MITLHDLITRSSPPAPWSEGDNIPWDEPGFSTRMLAEHLNQEHDLASRRSATIQAHIAALAATLPPPPGRILDLACGPGLYLTRLADLGYAGTGIDFSPASIDHARSLVPGTEHNLDYRLDDLRTADFGSGFDAALLLYGQLNVFRRPEARSIIARALAALTEGGVFVVEPQTFEQIRSAGQALPVWSSHEEGLFSTEPHLLLMESFWDDDKATSTQRFDVVDATTGVVARHAMSNEAYTNDELESMLLTAGFGEIKLWPSLSGEEADDGLMVVVGRKT